MKPKLRSFTARLDTDLSYCKITGIETLSDGRIILCDNHNCKLKLFQNDGTFLSYKSVDELPLDLCMISPYTAVVTTEIGYKLLVFNIVGDQIIYGKDISITPGAVGICNADENIMLTYPWRNPPEVVKINSEGQVIQTFKKNSKNKPIFSEHPLSICEFSGQLYVSCMSICGKGDQIFKFSKEGKLLATLEHPNLKEARYLNKDMFGNIYVCCLLTSNIIRFDRSDQSSSVIMSLKDGLRDACAISILDQTLIIAQDGIDIVKVLTIESYSEKDK